jgi:hypothetical protein
MEVFDEVKLVQELQTLSWRNRIAFAASCCERLFPNYQAFVIMEKWGDSEILRQALDEIWAFLAGKELQEKQFLELKQNCEQIIPDTEDFNSIFTGAALNAAAAITYTLECCLNKEAEWAALAGRVAINTLDEYIATVNDPETGYHTSSASFYEWVQQAPLMIAELSKQRHDLDTLRSRENLDLVFLKELRQISSSQGIQPFLRGIVKIP